MLAAVCAAPARAQYDARQRDLMTAVQDALAQMPVQTKEEFDREAGDLAKAAPESVRLLAGMLQPASKGANAAVEYALSAMVAYVSDPANAAYAQAVAGGFEDAIAACPDETNRAFLESQYRLIAPAKEIEVVVEKIPAKKVLATAKELSRSANSSDRCRSLWLKADVKGGLSAAEVLAVLKDSDAAYRNTALEIASEYPDGKTEKKVVAKYASLSPEARADVAAWIGGKKDDSYADFLISCASDAPAASDAIAALGKLTDGKAAEYLLGLLGTGRSGEAMRALESMKYDLTEPVVAGLGEAAGARLVALEELAAHRSMKEAAGSFFGLLGSGDRAAADAAKKGLYAVVSEKDTDRIASLLEKASAADAPYYMKALDASVSSLGPDARYARISALAAAAPDASVYYPAIAACGTDKAVAELAGYCASGDGAALSALLTADNYKAADALAEVVRRNPAEGERVLPRIVSLVSKYDGNIDRKAGKYIEALSLASDSATRNAILLALQDAPVMKTFVETGKYIDAPETAYSAATSAKNIASKTKDDIDYADYKSILEKAAEVFAAAGSADDGYAVDEIRLMLSKAKPYERTELSAEEKAEGFELLFDGSGLDKWTGDMDGYTPVNGTIYVTAPYGNSRNLYTKKEYRDFIFRFEFCFDREGVNNGVGIRTPMGVDAAYDGMCEVQILDHDAPIYKGLHEYQVHGSAYGIVPAKRVVHKPLGEWNTQEIVVRGDRVKVTLNGEVILDADLREACSGHNVAPDGGKTNPYTVDHKNHPGLFNEKGHIGFLGHGAGIRFRNVRVKAL